MDLPVVLRAINGRKSLHIVATNKNPPKKIESIETTQKILSLVETNCYKLEEEWGFFIIIFIPVKGSYNELQKHCIKPVLIHGHYSCPLSYRPDRAYHYMRHKKHITK